MDNKSNRFKTKKKRKISPQTDYFFQNGIEYIDYKDTATLRKFINQQGRIIHHTYSQLTAKNQRRVATAIKRARQMALLPYMIAEQNE